MIDHTRIYLLRHGQVDGFQNFPIYGSTDIGLTDIGVLQMEKAAERLRLVDISAIYSSDLTRSVASAKIISRYHDSPFFCREELREISFGEWEGLTLEQIRQRFPEELKRRAKDVVNYRPPGASESIGELAQRVMGAIKEILKRHLNSQIVIVAHGAVNRVILCNALGLDLNNLFRIQQDYGCLNIIDYFPDHTLVRLMNG